MLCLKPADSLVMSDSRNDTERTYAMTGCTSLRLGIR